MVVYPPLLAGATLVLVAGPLGPMVVEGERATAGQVDRQDSSAVWTLLGVDGVALVMADPRRSAVGDRPTDARRSGTTLPLVALHEKSDRASDGRDRRSGGGPRRRIGHAIEVGAAPVHDANGRAPRDIDPISRYLEGKEPDRGGRGGRSEPVRPPRARRGAASRPRPRRPRRRTAADRPSRAAAPPPRQACRPRPR